AGRSKTAAPVDVLRPGGTRRLSLICFAIVFLLLYIPVALLTAPSPAPDAGSALSCSRWPGCCGHGSPASRSACAALHFAEQRPVGNHPLEQRGEFPRHVLRLLGGEQ